MNLGSIESTFIAAKPAYARIAPGWQGIFAKDIHIAAKIALKAYGPVKSLVKRTPTYAVAGEFLGGRITGRIGRPVVTRVDKLHQHAARTSHDRSRKNGMGGRGWIYSPGRYPMTIIFHDANRVGPHIDIHIGRLSVVYRVKPDLYAQLRFNKDGYLTENSRQLLMKHVQSEIRNGARVPQNLDHSITNGRTTWVGGDPNAPGYGAGKSRQIVAQGQVDVYKAYPHGPIEMYAPLIEPDHAMYIYKIYPGDERTAPILIWGNRTAGPPVLEDRLHLKMILPDDFERSRPKLDMSTSTIKYDGSSCYIVITSKGTTVWSPRQSKVSGRQIEYTHKLNNLANAKSEETIVAMGEIVMYRKDRWGRKTYLPQAEGSGLLNSHELMPKDVHAQVMLYRVDRVGRQNTRNLGFWENRELQRKVAKLNPDHLDVVHLASPEQALEQGHEGVVVMPLDKSGGKPTGVDTGFKVKYWEDPNDWQIDAIEFHPGERGGIAGVVRCTSLESGKKFKLGPGQMGDRELCTDMMNNPEAYLGTVVKVSSRKGHEGRAAKVIGFHDDKGYAVG